MVTDSWVRPNMAISASPATKISTVRPREMPAIITAPVFRAFLARSGSPATMFCATTVAMP